jgi:hypothetical protein
MEEYSSLCEVMEREINCLLSPGLLVMNSEGKDYKPRFTILIDVGLLTPDLSLMIPRT